MTEFFPESERTGPPVGGRPHSTEERARARRKVTVGDDNMESTKDAKTTVEPNEAE